MESKHWFQRLLTPPSSRDFDERFRNIHELAVRDGFIAAFVFLLLLYGITQFSHFAGASAFIFSVMPALAFTVGFTAIAISLAYRGGGNWKLYRWAALISLLWSPFFVMVVLLPNLMHRMHFQPLIVVPFLVLYLGIPLLIIGLSLYYERNEPLEETPVRNLRSLIGMGGLSVLLALGLVFMVVISREQVQTINAQGIFMGFFFILGLCGLLIAIARLQHVELPSFLQNAPRLSSGEQTLVNRRFLLMSIFLMVLSLIFLLGSFRVL